MTRGTKILCLKGRAQEGAPCVAVQHRGFTLVESMMSVVLLGILAVFALPSFNEMAEKRYLTNTAEQLAAFLNSVQVESVHRNQIVTISYARTNNATWCVGAVLGETACDCAQTTPTELDFCTIESAPMVLDEGDVGDRDLVKSMTGDGSYAFDPVRGLFVDSSDLLLLELESEGGAYKLDLTVNNNGHITLCSKDTEHKVPGYQICSNEA